MTNEASALAEQTITNPTEQVKEIETPPSPELKVSCIIPVFDEYENGNIFRFLESFTKQNAPVEDYELIFVVNNRVDDAQENSRVYQDNQKTLQVESYLKSKGILPEGLNEYQAKILKKVKEMRMAVHMLDLTQGVERNMGLIFDIGYQQAISRFDQATTRKKRGAISMLAADVLVSHDYIQKISQHFADGNTEAAFAAADSVVVEGSEQIYQSTYAYQYQLEKWLLSYLLYKESAGITGISGPRIITSVAGYEKVGGVNREMGSNEDFDLAERLMAKTNYEMASDIRIYIGDRARESGFDAKARHMGMTDPLNIVEHSPVVGLLAKRLIGIEAEDSDILVKVDKLGEIFEQYNLLFDKQVFADTLRQIEALPKYDYHYPWLTDDPEIRRMDRENEIRETISLYLTLLGEKEIITPLEYTEKLIEIIEHNANPREKQTFKRLITRNKHNEAIRLQENVSIVGQSLDRAYVLSADKINVEELELTVKQREFLERNPWMIDKLRELRTTQSDAESAFTSLREEYPDLLKPLDSSPHRLATAQIRAINQFLLQVKSEPIRFGTIGRFLQSCSGFEELAKSY